MKQANDEKPKCEDIGFEHYWEDITSTIMLAIWPPRIPPKQRKCRNCGREEVLKVIQPKIEEWRSVSHDS